MALAAAPASFLIAVTQHVSTNITAMPLLWVAPLTLYLATFIIAFTRRAALPDLILAFLVPCAATVAIATSKVEVASMEWADPNNTKRTTRRGEADQPPEQYPV